MSCIPIYMFSLSYNMNRLLQVTKISLVKIIYLFTNKIKNEYFYYKYYYNSHDHDHHHYNYYFNKKNEITTNFYYNINYYYYHNNYYCNYNYFIYYNN